MLGFGGGLILSAFLVLFGRGRKQGDRPCALERGGERALVPGARPGHSTGQDLPAVADETAQPRDLLVVDVLDFLHAQAAHLPVLPLRPPRPASARFTLWTLGCHRHLLRRHSGRSAVAARLASRV